MKKRANSKMYQIFGTNISVSISAISPIDIFVAISNEAMGHVAL